MNVYHWQDGMGYGLELRLTQADVDTVPLMGPADEAVAELRRDKRIEGQLQAWTVAAVNSHLKEYGSWDEEERADHEMNLTRALWLACGDIHENPMDYLAADESA
jgi:hypothetical protein